MDVTINVFAVMGINVLAVIMGFFIGRRENRMLLQEAEAEAGVGNPDQEAEEQVHHVNRRHRNEVRRIPQGKSIASPVTGAVRFFCEGGRKGVVIEPEQGMVYAPMSGKIVKLYPMGNAFILQSDEQEEPKELLIQVGRQHPDELCSMYYRSRIVQNELVSKGKLLLEFDIERLQEAGEEIGVMVGLAEGTFEGDIVVTQKERVKMGEEIMKTY